MSKEDVINYVMTTPSNPNKAVLEGMLDSIADAGGGGGDADTSDIRITLTGLNGTLGADGLCLVYNGGSAPNSQKLYKEVIINSGINKLSSSAAFDGAKESLERIVVKSPLERIASGMFFGYSAIKEAIFLSETNISDGCFASCTTLEHVYLPSDASAVATSAFLNCTQSNLVIDCGFAEGAISGAPWGATNATINYNVPAPTDI